MKCDIHNKKNAHPKTSPTEFDGVQQFQFQTSQIFPQNNQVLYVYELVVCGDRKKNTTSIKPKSNSEYISVCKYRLHILS